MKKRANRHRLKEIRKENQITDWVIFCVGLLLFIVGLIKLLFYPAELAVNARYLQPTIDNGGTILVVGVVLLACSVYRYRNMEKVVKDISDLENDDL